MDTVADFKTCLEAVLKGSLRNASTDEVRIECIRKADSYVLYAFDVKRASNVGVFFSVGFVIFG